MEADMILNESGDEIITMVESILHHEKLKRKKLKRKEKKKEKKYNRLNDGIENKKKKLV